MEKSTLKERFWAKVIKTDGCWQWNAAKHSAGYGMINPGNGAKNKITASRASWMVHFGGIPAGMQVCHRCDNPECTNPEHLFLGSASDNAFDKEQKLRGLRKFAQQECDQIHTLLALGVPKRSVARAFQSDRGAIETASKYGRLLQESEVKMFPVKPRKGKPPVFTGESNKKAKVSDEDVLKIRELRLQGMPAKDIASFFPVGVAMIYHICKRRNWKHI